MPGGGFVTSYSDVTAYKRAQRALQESNETLEVRVTQRIRGSLRIEYVLRTKAQPIARPAIRIVSPHRPMGTALVGSG